MEQQGSADPSGPSWPPVGRGYRRAAGPGDGEWQRALRGAILSRVVPRLSAPGPDGEGPAAAEPVLTEEDVAHFAGMALAAPVPGLVRHVEALRAEGLSSEAAMLGLLAPAARHLGDLWLADRLSFLDVTTGLGRLQGVLRALGPGFDGRRAGRPPGRRILLAPVPGEQHVFGLSVVAAFFRRAGWCVTFEPRIAWDDLLDLARAEPFAAIGLSVGGDRFLSVLPAQVEALRRAARDPRVALLGGGPAFLLDTTLGDRAGFDAVASDAAEAVRIAQALPDPLAAAA